MNFLLGEMPLSEAAIFLYEQKQIIFTMPPGQILILMLSFICTNFEAFLIFSSIFTRTQSTKRIIKLAKIIVCTQFYGFSRFGKTMSFNGSNTPVYLSLVYTLYQYRFEPNSIPFGECTSH